MSSAVRYLAIAGLLLPVISIRAQVVERPIPGDPVAVDSGLVAGKLPPSGVKAYFGVPFAAAPVRELRWQEPQPVKRWKGVYNADRMAPECIQVLRAHNINHYFGEEATSEDCLYLNIWVEGGATPASKLPVVTYIYGGGSTIGSSGMGNYDGENVARRGAVFVNFNYRVGALGFMAHPELTAESPHHASGNYGYLDQLAALQWIHRNIAKFGGDPDKVVVTGQSAGAASISLLQASPLARGLFRGFVAMSGSAWGGGGRAPALADAEKIGLQVQDALKVKSLAELRQLPADKILAIQQDCQLGCAGSIRIGGANIDGYFLPQSPAELFAERRQSDVPAILGFTHDESSNSLRAAKSLGEYRAEAQKLYGARAEEFLKLYPASNDAEAAEMGRTAAREGMIEPSMRNWAIAQTEFGSAPVYMYMFSKLHPFTPGLALADMDPKTVGAYHTADVPYWFQSFGAYNRFRVTRNWGPADKDLSDKMGDLLIALAATGKPSTSAVQWPAWTPNKEQLVEFGDATRILPMDTRRLNFHAAGAGTRATPRLPRD